MKKGSYFLPLALLFPAVATAAELGINGTTVVRFEERSHPGFSKERVTPATQFLGIDATRLMDGNLSLHLYGWGRQDLDNNSVDDSKSEGDLTYGYLQYRFQKANADLRAGRLFVSEGVGREQLDGLAIRTDLAGGFTLALYGGAPVKQDNSNRGDLLAGGRIALRQSGWLDLGASFLHENGTVSQQYNGSTSPPTTITDTTRQLAGGDIWFSPFSAVQVNGYTSYNLTTSSVAEHNYQLQIKPVKELTISGTYTERLFKGYFDGTNLPNLFKPDSHDDVKQYGGSITLAVAEPLELTVDYQNIERSSTGTTDRYGASARLDMKTISTRAGVGYHRYQTPNTSVTVPYDLSFHQVNGWVIVTLKDITASIDLLGNFYDDHHYPSLNGESKDYTAAASLGYRITPAINLSGDLSYGKNALLDEEFKGLIRAEFAFNIEDKRGKK
ncbi:MAG TPA: hypothetical protein VFF53_07105 [Geobacteraceae bacterium]|nr:hypothetical protein [Geobacteraceae bacterium]